MQMPQVLRVTPSDTGLEVVLGGPPSPTTDEAQVGIAFVSDKARATTGRAFESTTGRFREQLEELWHVMFFRGQHERT